MAKKTASNGRHVRHEEAAEWPVYTIALDSLASGSFARARHVGWHRIWQDEQGDWIAGEYGLNKQVYAELKNKAVEHLHEHRKFLNTVPGIDTGRYEIRELSVPSIYLECFWLHSLSGGPDRFMSIQPKPGVLSEGWVYSATDFVQMVRPLIKHGVARVSAGA